MILVGLIPYCFAIGMFTIHNPTHNAAPETVVVIMMTSGLFLRLEWLVGRLLVEEMEQLNSN